MLAVHEIFTTIQGEGYDTGIPCTFVRLYGCNLNCKYCDQPQRPSDRKIMEVAEVLEEVQKFKTKNVCLTGGEPLAQKQALVLAEVLSEFGYNVSIETNGSLPIRYDEKRRYKYVMDIKCPSSGVEKNNLYSNMNKLTEQDEVKFIIADKSDYYFMKTVLQVVPTKAKVLLSPMFDHNLKQTIGKDLCEWVIEDNLDVKIQIQLHKILGVL